MLENQAVYELDGGGAAGIRMSQEEETALSEIINVLNKRFGTEFSTADKLYFDQIYEELIADDHLAMQAQSNTMENFKYGFEDKFIDTTINRMEQNQDIFSKMMNDKDFGNIVRDYMLKKVYQQFRK